VDWNRLRVDLTFWTDPKGPTLGPFLKFLAFIECAKKKTPIASGGENGLFVAPFATRKPEEFRYQCFRAFDRFCIKKLKEFDREILRIFRIVLVHLKAASLQPPSLSLHAHSQRYGTWQAGKTCLGVPRSSSATNFSFVIFPDQRLFNLSPTSDTNTNPHSFAPPAPFSSRLDFSLDSAAIVSLLRSWLERSVSCPFSTHQIAHSTHFSPHKIRARLSQILRAAC
jgi:hypothetical protein